MSTSAHSAEVLHQFDSLAQQRLAVRLGIWTFLVTEIMLFGAVFGAYTIYRFLYPAMFAASSHHLDVKAGAINTAVLIGSSLTMALAVHQAGYGRRRSTISFLFATMFLGTVFLGIKAYEYSHKIHDHLVPGPSFIEPAPELGSSQIFFSFYWMMTGIHAAHMIIGLGVLLAMVVAVWRNIPLERQRSQVEVTGLYWHFVDIVWVFLFPLLYLIGRHG
jgi:cytochrome c oxidase subunit III